MPFLFGILFSKCHKMAENKEFWRPRETSFAYLITKVTAENDFISFQVIFI